MKSRGNILLLVLLAVGTFIRIYIASTFFDEFYDYDEGTYLLVGRLINEGYLPYRDIFAVHPPLYYYTLALWMKTFGNNYITGRMLSIFLGVISAIILYLIGKELRNEEEGMILSLFVLFHPLLVKMNSLAHHTSMIEFFSVLSLYYLVRFLKTSKRKYAYLSLASASLGSTAKFTIIPFLITIYIFLLALGDSWLRKKLKDFADFILSMKFVGIVTISYLTLILIEVLTFILIPKKHLFAIPGLQDINSFLQNVYPAFLFSILLLLLIYLFSVLLFEAKFFTVLIEAFLKFAKNWKIVIGYGLVIFTIKAVVEIPLGILIDRSYVFQTYLAQRLRMFPFLGIFWYAQQYLSFLMKGDLDMLLFQTPLILLILLVCISKFLGVFSEQNPLREDLKALGVLTFVMYFLVFSIVPFDRFLLPFWILVYVILIDHAFSLKLSKKSAISFILAGMVVFAVADFGIVYKYAEKREIFRRFGGHVKELRENLAEVVEEENITALYSINPMNTYILNVNTYPRIIDFYGLVIFRNLTIDQLISTLKENGINHIVCSSWCLVKWPSPKLNEELRYVVWDFPLRYELVYGESYPNGDFIELYELNTYQKKIALKTGFGKLLLLTPNGVLAEIRFNHTEIIKSGESYVINRKIYAKINENYITLTIPKSSKLTLTILPQILYERKDGNSLKFLLPKACVEISSDGSVKRIGNEIVIEGRHAKIQWRVADEIEEGCDCIECCSYCVSSS